ncbi:MAG: type II toxin-antitoxin system RelE/ParE family toxin [Xanthomonadales bacterium]|nr:type II toxin-antitoxin system RelE/ParE family toxin [Xanthomonadales bacterium]
MPKVAVELAESAVRDLEGIRDWFAEEHAPEVGERLVREILDQAESLAIHPDMGRVVPEFDQIWLRELIHPPFRIVYKRESDCVRIVRVWRSEQLLKLSGDS